MTFNYLWRLIATGFSYIVFGLGGLLLSFLVFPSVIIFNRDKKRRKKKLRSLISYSFRYFLKMMDFLGVLNFSIKGGEVLQNESHCLLVANHPTLIDVVAIIAFTPNACCVVKGDLWRNPFIKMVILGAEYIPNDNSSIVLSKCKESIYNGDVLVIFPEGTRTRDGETVQFKRGAAHLIHGLKCHVRCVFMECRPLTLSKGVSWYAIPRSTPNFSLVVGGRFDFYSKIDSSLPRPLAVRKLNRLLIQQYCGNG